VVSAAITVALGGAWTRRAEETTTVKRESKD
jgi:hypothetical protein